MILHQVKQQTWRSLLKDKIHTTLEGRIYNLNFNPTFIFTCFRRTHLLESNLSPTRESPQLLKRTTYLLTRIYLWLSSFPLTYPSWSIYCKTRFLLLSLTHILPIVLMGITSQTLTNYIALLFSIVFLFNSASLSMWYLLC